MNTIIIATLYQLRALLSLEQAQGSAPGNFAKIIEGEISNHELTWELFEELLKHYTIPQIFEVNAEHNYIVEEAVLHDVIRHIPENTDHLTKISSFLADNIV